MRKAVIITGGGSGKRMGTPVPKQFLKIDGKPVIVYTIELFSGFDKNMEIVVVLPESYLELWKEINAEFFNKVNIRVAPGGDFRFHSVKSGLSLLKEDMLIGVHDAVRPLVSMEVINRCYSVAEKYGNAVPVIKMTDSIRRISGASNFPANREDFRIIQTPQVFSGEILKKAYNLNFSEEFTDDASVVEKLGVKINLVEGNRENIKITTPEDIKYVEQSIQARQKEK
jgi:2-C-methyl-D-erythritol 4-phosphate cytidylyltransferase